MAVTKQMKALESLFPDDSTRTFQIELINSLPNIVAILNEDRRLVYSNQITLDKFSIPTFEAAFDLRPGELFKCVNSTKEPEGCGASEACELCGALRAMEDSKATGELVTNDCKILAKEKSGVNSYNFKFTATPFNREGQFYYVVSIEDISGEKRKEELERIFFHDIMNSISSIQGVLELMKNQAKADPLHLRILDAIYVSLFDTVNEQKQFTQAENGDLKVNKKEIQTNKILKEAKLHFNFEGQFKPKLIIDEDSAELNTVTDEVLLLRILINMIKNSFEASDVGDIVTVGTSLIDNNLRFFVSNPAFIPRNTQLLIFDRSFSTKGSGRGLGTFSMKLLGENYLGGKVDFTSTEKEGTTFWIDLPL
jgi:hypothetical protein